ncbi:PREDICTED: uncharacterized protein LOC105953870 [Erythranthe guttata]|uniref:uncharacterized protein LOC105953870 n=1 Tax=Erythranthe guttata TaxID=4155 RepID=UPI00064D97DC|nr:PREDICTED: uncharacterized protein LOC105953870 [Erythranthe guttata]|eukprot:XP_012833005.1 PREDICTED: uncharacterized protein LOC105953870 [Erythranthe guttata]
MTMNYTTTKYLLLILVLSPNLLQMMASSEKLKCLFTSKFEVYVASNLPYEAQPLTMHCASKDDDLGHHTLTTNQEFHFHFCLRPFATLFFCHLWWENKDSAFEVYNGNWRHDICFRNHTCYWVAKSDGIYFSPFYPPQELVKKYSWNENVRKSSH